MALQGRQRIAADVVSLQAAAYAWTARRADRAVRQPGGRLIRVHGRSWWCWAACSATLGRTCGYLDDLAMRKLAAADFVDRFVLTRMSAAPECRSGCRAVGQRSALPRLARRRLSQPGTRDHLAPTDREPDFPWPAPVSAVRLRCRTVRQCAVLVGGLGTRLGALTAKTPKPMLPCGDRPFLGWLLREFVRFGVEEFVLLTGHLSAEVEARVQALSALLPRAARIVICEEPVRAGTGGAVFHARDRLDRTVPAVQRRFAVRLQSRPLLSPAAPTSRSGRTHGAAPAGRCIALRRRRTRGRPRQRVPRTSGRRHGRPDQRRHLPVRPPPARRSVAVLLAGNRHHAAARRARRAARHGGRRLFPRHRHPRGFRPRAAGDSARCCTAVRCSSTATA